MRILGVQIYSFNFGANFFDVALYLLFFMNPKYRTISQRLFLAAVAISFVAVGSVSFFYDREAEAAIVQRSFDQLASVRTLKQSKVEEYFESLSAMLAVLASHPVTVLTSTREMRLRYDVEDVLILSRQGKIVYTEHDSTLLGSQMPDTAWSAVRNALHLSENPSTKTSRVQFTDFMRFRGKIVAFGIVRIDTLAAKEKTLLPQSGAIILVQISLHALNSIMTERTGLGQTGESYIVGSDSLMRTESRFVPSPTILHLPVRTEPVRQALAGKTAFLETKDYRNVDVLSACAPLRIGTMRWAIISELDVEEITIPINATRGKIIVLGFSITLLMAIISWYGARTISEPIVRLQESLSVIAEGKLPEKPLPIKRRDEIGAMTEELNTMTASLRQAALFARDIGAGKFDAECPPRSESDMLVIALNDMKRELQRLLADKQSSALQRTLALVEGEERERIRLARDVHDGIGQTLTALRFNLARVVDDEMRSELCDLLDDAIAEVRAIAYNLMPGVLLDFGLSAALEQLCTNVANAATIDIQRKIAPLSKRLDAAREIAIYRIAQEAFTNALRYSEADVITLTFSVKADNSSVQLDILDNGIGFDTAEYVRGNGLANMRERALLFGGEVRIASHPRKGTHIVVEMPIG
jgi:signal transduction histidine kinase